MGSATVLRSLQHQGCSILAHVRLVNHTLLPKLPRHMALRLLTITQLITKIAQDNPPGAPRHGMTPNFIQNAVGLFVYILPVFCKIAPKIRNMNQHTLNNNVNSSIQDRSWLIIRPSCPSATRVAPSWPTFGLLVTACCPICYNI